MSETDVQNVEHPLELEVMRTPEGRDKSKAPLRVMQYEVDLSAAAVGATPVYWRPVKMEDADGLDLTGTDMPAYNLRTRGKKHCFFWGESVTLFLPLYFSVPLSLFTFLSLSRFATIAAPPPPPPALPPYPTLPHPTPPHPRPQHLYQPLHVVLR